MTTARQLPLSRLGHLVPPLVDNQALVALLVLTDDLAWAAKAAWDIARIAAKDGRRVALIDLHLDRPVLHEIVGLSTGDGIVDAFDFGVSLNKAAHEVTGVFFIPAGSDTANPAELYAQPRWRKLQAGFRAEGALMLVFVPPAGLTQLAAAPDGVLALAPEGLPDGFALGRDVPLFGVVRDRWLPSSSVVNARPSPAPFPLPIAPERPERPRTRWTAMAGVIIVGLGLGAWALLAAGPTRWPSRTEPPPPPPPPAPAPAPAAPPSAAQPPPAAAVRADTAGWTIQLAAYASLDKALAHADRLAADAGVPALVTPAPQGRSGTVWYRVLAGSYRTRAEAGAGRADLWKRGFAARGVGDLFYAPYSYRAPEGASVTTLRRRGLPAVRWSNGAVLLGAFKGPDQAATTRTALTRAGVRANLLPRMETP